MIAVVEYGIGNIQSVVNALVRAGAETKVVSSGQALHELRPDKIVLPGVGATSAAMKLVRERDLAPALQEQVIDRGTELLAICVGMQILAETCEEFSRCDGLGWIPGHVRRLNATDPTLRIPHVGWNRIDCRNSDTLLESLNGSHFYFVHSYAMECPTEFVTAVVEYGGEVVCGVQRDNIRGYQFHPEKSSAAGENLLQSFVAN